jgi:hypothetical protein
MDWTEADMSLSIHSGCLNPLTRSCRLPTKGLEKLHQARGSQAMTNRTEPNQWGPSTAIVFQRSRRHQHPWKSQR